MTSCETARDALVELVFSELDDEACARLNEHLATCADCRATERDLLAMRERVRGAAPTPDPALERRIRTAVAVLRPAPPAFWRRPVPAYVVLTASALCTVATLLLVAPRPPAVPPLRDEPADTTGVPIPAGEPAFSAAEAFATGVRGTGATAVHGDSLRRGSHRPHETL